MTLVYANMKMSEAIESHLALVPVVNRFGIRLGVGDDTVKAVCDAHNVDPDFFLTIVNTFINEDYFPEKKLQNFHLSQIIDYLKKTNLYYLQNQLPNIERHLHFFLHASDNTSLRLLGDMFASFKEGLRRRIEADEREWFPLLLTPPIRRVAAAHVPSPPLTTTRPSKPPSTTCVILCSSTSPEPTTRTSATPSSSPSTPSAATSASITVSATVSSCP